jgi:hypothetical protein
MDVTLEATVRDVIARYPSTAEIFLQQGQLFRTRPGHLYAVYDPPLAVAEYAALNGLAPEPLLRLLRAAAETDEARRGAHQTTSHGPMGRTPPVGSIGYTGSYREPSADVPEISWVETLEAQGPE